MRHEQRRIGRLAVVAAVTVLLAGCSQLPGYPTLPIGDVIGQKTLTQEQQDAEIKELSDAQVQNTAQAGTPEADPEYIPAAVNDQQ